MYWGSSVVRVLIGAGSVDRSYDDSGSAYSDKEWYAG